VVPKTTKTSGKSAKQGAKARGSAKPVRKSPAKPARKPAGAAPGKKASKPAKPAGSKAPAKKSAAPKAAAKPAAKKPVAAKPAPAKAKTAGKPKAAATRPAAVRVVSPAPRHPQRKPEPAAAAAKSASAAKPVAAEPAAVARPMVAARPMPPAKRPFSRESVRVGEARHAQPAGSRPVFPPEFLERQRERLQVKKQEILAMYQKDLKSGQESNDSPTEDLVDRANNAYTRELAFSISDSERELMQQIDLAIERLKAGSYGFCLHTGQQIGQARLEAIPWAKYSVEAQELLEKGLLSEA
jgi:DnaK suppressor protein